MRCSICGIRIDSVEEAVKEGWTPHYYDLSKKAGKVSGKTSPGSKKIKLNILKT
jgi:hypothetical protein